MSRKFMVAEMLKLAGFTDEKMIDGLAGLADLKFVFGPSDVKVEPEKFTGRMQLTVNGEPCRFGIVIEGKIVQQIEALFASLGLKPENAPVIMQPSPSQPAPAVDFLAPTRA